MVSLFCGINWRDDIISAGISTVLAIGISGFFYRKSNRVAFYNDILHPIAGCVKFTTDSYSVALRVIHEKKNLYIFRYANKKEKKAINRLENSLNEVIEQTFEKAFANSVISYFFEKYKIDSTHERWIEELGEYVVETNFPNFFRVETKLKELSDWFDAEGYDEHMCIHIEELLKSFYENEVKGSINIDNMKIFEGTTIDKILYSSDQYQQYKKAKNELENSINEIKHLDV